MDICLFDVRIRASPRMYETVAEIWGPVKAKSLTVTPTLESQE